MTISTTRRAPHFTETDNLNRSIPTFSYPLCVVEMISGTSRKTQKSGQFIEDRFKVLKYGLAKRVGFNSLFRIPEIQLVEDASTTELSFCTKAKRRLDAFEFLVTVSLAAAIIRSSL